MLGFRPLGSASIASSGSPVRIATAGLVLGDITCSSAMEALLAPEMFGPLQLANVTSAGTMVVNVAAVGALTLGNITSVAALTNALVAIGSLTLGGVTTSGAMTLASIMKVFIALADKPWRTNLLSYYTGASTTFPTRLNAVDFSEPPSPPEAGLNWVGVNNTAASGCIYESLSLNQGAAHSGRFLVYAPDGVAPVVTGSSSDPAADFAIVVRSARIAAAESTVTALGGNFWEVKYENVVAAPQATGNNGIARYVGNRSRELRFAGFVLEEAATWGGAGFARSAGQPMTVGGAGLGMTLTATVDAVMAAGITLADMATAATMTAALVMTSANTLGNLTAAGVMTAAGAITAPITLADATVAAVLTIKSGLVAPLQLGAISSASAMTVKSGMLMPLALAGVTTQSTLTVDLVMVSNTTLADATLASTFGAKAQVVSNTTLANITAVGVFANALAMTAALPLGGITSAGTMAAGLAIVMPLTLGGVTSSSAMRAALVVSSNTVLANVTSLATVTVLSSMQASIVLGGLSSNMVLNVIRRRIIVNMRTLCATEP